MEKKNNKKKGVKYSSGYQISPHTVSLFTNNVNLSLNFTRRSLTLAFITCHVLTLKDEPVYSYLKCPLRE